MQNRVQQSDRYAARGYTALEVILALAVTGVIAVCLVSLLGASSQIWRQEHETVSRLIGGARVQSYLERMLRESHDFGYSASGEGVDPPAILLWSHDLRSRQSGESRDHQIQQCELLLIRYDPAAQKLIFHLPMDWTEMTSAQQAEAGALVEPAAFAEKATADAFLARDWVHAHVLAGASANEKVTAMWIEPDRTSTNPIVRFRIDLARDGASQTLYGIVRMRVPGQQDNWSSHVLEQGPSSGGEDDPFDF